MDKKTAGALLALLFILVAGLRLTFALSEPTLTFDGHRELRLMSSLIDTGLPLFEDALSFGGRHRVYSPLFDYIILPWTFILGPTLALKTIPNVLYASMVLLVYFAAQDITKHRIASLLGAILAAFTPITFAQYINDASPSMLAIPLFLGTFYALLDIKKRLALFIIMSILLSLTSPIVFILVAGLLLFLMLCGLESIKVDEGYSESAFFLLFFGLWSTLIIYKIVFLDAGFSALWQYLPEALFERYYADFTTISAIATIGVLPIMFGGHAAYHAVFERRERKVLLAVGMVAAALIALLTRLVPLRMGMMLLTLMLSILAAHSLTILFRYLKKTRAPQTKYLIVGGLMLFFIFASTLPALSRAAEEVGDVPSPEHQEVARWIMNNTKAESRILATPKEGFFIEQAAQRETLIDRDFVLIDNANALYETTEAIYRARFVLPALERLNKHGVTHVLFTNEATQMYARDSLFFTPHECFDLVYEDAHVRLYEVVCNVKTD